MDIGPRTIGLGVAIGLLAMAPGHALGAKAWHPDVAIAPTASFPGPPAATLGARGEALGAWTARTASGRWRVEARTRRGYRSAWVPEPVSGSFSRPPSRVAAALGAEGAAVVAWRVPGGPVRAAARLRRGAAWTVLPVPSGPAAAAFTDFWSPLLTLGPAGEATLLWAAREPAGWVVRGARRNGPGSPWREAPALATGAQPAIGLAPSGDAVAAWPAPASASSPAGGPLQAALRAGTGAWGAVATLSASGRAPSAATAGGRALVAWEEPSGSAATQTLRLAAGDPASGAWTPPETVAAGREPSVAVDDRGDTLLAWAGTGAGQPGNRLLAAVRPAGSGWPAPATLAAAESLTALEIDGARVAIAPTGRAVVGVNDPEGPGTATATLATLPIGGGAWDTTRVPVGGDDADMALATGASGDLLALVPASAAVSGGETVLAVSHDGAVRPAVAARARGRRRADGTVAWTVTVRNTGSVVARGVRLRLFVCCGARLLSARPAGTPGAGAAVGWRLGTLAPGRATTVCLSVRPSPSETSPRLNGQAWAIAAPRVAVAGREGVRPLR